MLTPANPAPRPSRAVILSDEVIYQRSLLGQRELLRRGNSDELTQHLLARVNGFTPLRRLLDLSSEDPSAIGRAVEKLFEAGLIEFAKLGHRGAASRQATPARRASPAAPTAIRFAY